MFWRWRLRPARKRNLPLRNGAFKPSGKSLIKDADSNNSGVSDSAGDIYALPDSRINSLPANPEPEISGASSDDSGRNGISDDDDEENDDDRKVPGKPKRK